MSSSNSNSTKKAFNPNIEGFNPPQEKVVPIRRFARTHRAPDLLCLNVEVKEHSLGDLNEPNNYKAAILDLVDYEETFSPIVDIRAIRILIAIVSFYDYEIWQMDLSNYFLPLTSLATFGFPTSTSVVFERACFVVENLASTLEEANRMQNVPYASAVGSIINPEAELRVNCYCNAGFKTNRDDINSQTGYVSVLNKGAVD
nr:zinc finger, CCHC-type [Tanacetum cinerariifolium]